MGKRTIVFLFILVFFSIKTEKNQILNYEKEGSVSTIMLRSRLMTTFIEIQVGPK